MLKPHIKYQIIHPTTGVVETWKGERINVYQRTYKVAVEMAETKIKETPKTIKDE